MVYAQLPIFTMTSGGQKYRKCGEQLCSIYIYRALFEYKNISGSIYTAQCRLKMLLKHVFSDTVLLRRVVYSWM